MRSASPFGCQSHLPAHACVRIIFHEAGGEKVASSLRQLSALTVATTAHSYVFLLY